jgi:hypothetical protein
MKINVYIEPNFLMAIAKGQDSQALELLINPPKAVNILIPNICIIESILIYKIEENSSLSLQEEMRKRIRELSRDKTSVHTPSLIGNYEEAIITSGRVINNIRYRLNQAIEYLKNNYARIIYLDNDRISEICQTMLTDPETLPIKKDIMDNLILQCIINHARCYGKENKKVLISNNIKDFRTPEVKDALRQDGINYFSTTQHFFDWFNSASVN